MSAAEQKLLAERESLAESSSPSAPEAEYTRMACCCGLHDPANVTSGGSSPADVPNGGSQEAFGAGRTELIAQSFDQAEQRYEFTGDQNVDAVLIGSRWTLTEYTFSFPTSGSFYSGQGYTEGEPDQQSPLNAQQQDAVRYAYSLLASYTGLVFREITETATEHADFRFSQTGASKVGSAYANFPSSKAMAGDVWIGTTGQPDYTTPAVGNWGMATIMHEMGHTMGLKHGHQDYTAVDLAGEGYLDTPPGGGPRRGSKALTVIRDGQAWSLMTYRSDPTDLKSSEQTEFEAGPDSQPQTYMQYDIAALQHLYGANFGHNGGSTIYSWSPTTGTMSVNGVAQRSPTGNKILMTLWDGNGNDTYDLSAYATDLDVDLRPGAFSTFSDGQLANHQSYSGGYAPAIGNVANALLYRGDLRSLIENATGGAGDDRMIGNQAGNVLRGGAGGDDLLIGGLGHDRLFGEAGADTLYGDGRAGVQAGVGMGSGVFNKNYGDGNWSMAGAFDLTNMFTLDPNGEVIDSFTTPHVTVFAITSDSYDYYRISLNAGTTITLDVDDGTFTDTMLYLLDANGNVITYNDDSALTDGLEGSLYTQDSFLTYTIAQSGVYYIALGEHFSSTQSQPFRAFSYYELQVSVAGVEAIEGAAGHDLLDGGAGADIMIGGAGNDAYVVDVAGDAITELAGGGIDTVRSAIGYTLSAQLENLVLTGGAVSGAGNAANNILTGNAAANTLSGAGGADAINGGAGADIMYGGAGNDIYAIDNAGDRANESANGGTDTVRSAIAYTLAANLENLVLVGAAAIGGGGNGLANRLTGNDAANRLDGAAGADVLTGALGNDVYIVDNAGDQIVEALAAGLDRVESSVSHSLSANVENLKLTGAAAINGTGNALANAIDGNAAVNILNGGDGNDTLNGFGGGDRMVGGLGGDIYVVDVAADQIIEALNAGWDIVRSAVSLTLANNVEVLTLLGAAAHGDGNSIANVINGNSAANRLDGRAGADRMAGGAGNDIYVVDNAADVVVEALAAGVDGVSSSVSFTLASNVENLTLVGGATRGSGNAAANTITGTAGFNALYGGGGLDSLSGGAGADRFYFDTAPNGSTNWDRILDFSVADDEIILDRTIFSALPFNGALAASAFVAGTAAADAGDRIIYDRASGSIYYDADGDGAGTQVLFARVTPGLALTHADFIGVA